MRPVPLQLDWWRLSRICSQFTATGLCDSIDWTSETIKIDRRITTCTHTARDGPWKADTLLAKLTLRQKLQDTFARTPAPKLRATLTTAYTKPIWRSRDFDKLNRSKPETQTRRGHATELRGGLARLQLNDEHKDNIGTAPLYGSVRLAVIRLETAYLTNMDKFLPSSPEPSAWGA